MRLAGRRQRQYEVFATLTLMIEYENMPNPASKWRWMRSAPCHTASEPRHPSLFRRDSSARQPKLGENNSNFVKTSLSKR